MDTVIPKMPARGMGWLFFSVHLETVALRYVFFATFMFSLQISVSQEILENYDVRLKQVGIGQYTLFPYQFTIFISYKYMNMSILTIYNHVKPYI